jgi:hypothetical protein
MSSPIHRSASFVTRVALRTLLLAGPVFPLHAQCGSGLNASMRTVGCMCDASCSQLPSESIDVDMTPDGRFVVFAAVDPAGNWQIYRHDRDGDEDGVFQDDVGRQTAQLTWSLTGSSRRPRISADGNSIVFTSTATDIIQACPSVDQNGNVADIYRIDLIPVLCGVTLANRSRVSVDATGCQGDDPAYHPSISADASRVAFLTRNQLDPTDTNGLTDLYVRTYLSVPCSQVTLQCAQPPAPPVCGVCDSTIAVESRGVLDPATQTDLISTTSHIFGGEVTPDGNHVLFWSDAPDLDLPGLDLNGTLDVFLRELLPSGGHTERLTNNFIPGLRATATPLTGSLASGTVAGKVAYEDLIPGGLTYILDLATGTTTSTALGQAAERPRIAESGNYVAFYRQGSTWIRDIALGAEARVDCGNGSTPLFQFNWTPPALTADGSEVAFVSSSTDLVNGDANGVPDAFVLRPTGLLGGPFCDASDGSLALCPCINPGASSTGCENAKTTGGVELRVAARTLSPPRMTMTGHGFPTMSAPTAIVLRSAGLNPAGPVVFRDGLNCLAAPTSMMGAAFASGGASEHVLDHTAGVGAYYYQLWYRSGPASYCDPVGASNTSNGQRVLW